MGLQPLGDTFNQRTGCLIERENTGNLKLLEDIAGGEKNTDGMRERIKNLCETCKKEGIILNPDKFTVGRKIDFGGFTVTRNIQEEGDAMTQINPKNHQLNKVANFPKPRTRKEVQRFMGCINVLRNWTNKIIASSPTLRKLMAGSTVFTWSEMAKEFEHLKRIARNIEFLSPYDEKINDIRINTDASREGIGYVVYQKRPDGKRNIIQMGSSALKDNQVVSQPVRSLSRCLCLQAKQFL